MSFFSCAFVVGKYVTSASGKCLLLTTNVHDRYAFVDLPINIRYC